MYTYLYPQTGASDLVHEGWSTATGYASTAFADATGFLDELAAIGQSIADIPDISAEVGAVNAVVNAFQAPATPDKPAGMDPNYLPVPELTGLVDVLPFDPENPPEFTATKPEIDLNVPLPAALDATVPPMPEITAPVFPDDLTIDLPAVPSLQGISLPAEPTLEIPSFDGVMPVYDLADPDTNFTFTEEEYTSSMLELLKAKLSEWIAGTATGIAPEVEQQIWDRARAREDAISLRNMEEVRRAFAARGFNEPPGALQEAMQQAIQKAQDNSSTVNRDVAIKQAELEQANIHFAIEEGIALESGLMEYAAGVAQRAFEAAKLTATIALDLFTAKVNRYRIEVEAYNTQAQVFNTLVQAALSRLEVYKAQLDGQRLIGELNTQQVQIYRTMVDAVMGTVEVYRAKVDAARAKNDANSNVIQQFGALVGAYEAQVRAKASEYDAYANRVRAEIGKVEVYKAEADAYGSQVQGFEAKIRAIALSKETEIKVNQEIPLERFVREVEAYKAQVGAEAERIGALAKIYESDTSLFDSLVKGETARVGSETEVYNAEVNRVIADANVRIQAAKENTEKMLSQARVLMETIRGGAAVAAQLAASALSMVNMSSSISASDSISNSATSSSSESSTTSESVVTSTSTNYNYSE